MRYRLKPGGDPHPPLVTEFLFYCFGGWHSSPRPSPASQVPPGVSRCGGRRVSTPTNLATHGAELFTFRHERRLGSRDTIRNTTQGIARLSGFNTVWGKGIDQEGRERISRICAWAHVVRKRSCRRNTNHMGFCRRRIGVFLSV